MHLNFTLNFWYNWNSCFEKQHAFGLEFLIQLNSCFERQHVFNFEFLIQSKLMLSEATWTWLWIFDTIETFVGSYFDKILHWIEFRWFFRILGNHLEAKQLSWKPKNSITGTTRIILLKLGWSIDDNPI